MSKSGSKALSKSVDSVVKSVESVVSSVVPKNMNMKHVLLAILVGLLLCMLMGNTVEGFGPQFKTQDSGASCGDDSTLIKLKNDDTNSTAGLDNTPYQDAGTPEYGCILTTDIAGNRSASGANDGSAITSDNWSTPTVAGSDPYACTTDSGPYQLDGNKCPAYCDDGMTGRVHYASPSEKIDMLRGGADDGSIGLCVAEPGSSMLDANECSKQTDERQCGRSVQCKFVTFGGEDSGVFGENEVRDPIHLRGLFEYIMALSGNTKNNCPMVAEYLPGGADTNDALNTKQLPLLTTQADGGVTSTNLGDDPTNKYKDWLKLKGGGDGENKYYDFFYLLLGSGVDDETSGKKKDVSLMIKQHDKLPLVLKNKLIAIVEPEEELWEEVSQLDDRALLNKNGGRIIAGYNKSDGLVIRNSISQPLVLPGSKTRAHVGPGCSDSWDDDSNDWKQDPDQVSCSWDSKCFTKAIRKKAIEAKRVTTIGDFVVPFGDDTIRNYCKLDSCANEMNYPECQLDKAANNLTSTIKNNFAAFVSGKGG